MPKSSSAIGLRYQIEEAIVFFLLCLILNYFDQYWTDIGTSHEVFGFFFLAFPAMDMQCDLGGGRGNC